MSFRSDEGQTLQELVSELDGREVQDEGQNFRARSALGGLDAGGPQRRLAPEGSAEGLTSDSEKLRRKPASPFHGRCRPSSIAMLANVGAEGMALAARDAYESTFWTGQW